jgi:hypothetical protein
MPQIFASRKDELFTPELLWQKRRARIGLRLRSSFPSFRGSSDKYRITMNGRRDEESIGRPELNPRQMRGLQDRTCETSRRFRASRWGKRCGLTAC